MSSGEAAAKRRLRSDDFNHSHKEAALQTLSGLWGGFFMRFSFSFCGGFPEGFRCLRNRRFFADKKNRAPDES